MTKTIFITGTSSGLGKQTAKHFAQLGWNVVATMRRPEQENELNTYNNILLLKQDVTDTRQTQAAVEAAIAAFGKIDVVVNNAGMGTYGPLELAKDKDIDWQYAVNVRGPINVMRAFLPHFRASGGGMFINISSFMGFTTAVPLGSLYNMSKFALEGLTEGLYYELKPLNIDLRLIEQGGTQGTNFTESVIWNENPDIDAYAPMTQKLQALFQNKDESLLDDPAMISQAIEELATRRSTQFRTVIGAAGNQLLNMRRSMPIEEYMEKIAASF